MTNPPHFEILRRVSRCTGKCSWGLYDNHANAEVFIGDTLREVIKEKEKLETPAPRWSYKCRTGQTGFITNDEE